MSKDSLVPLFVLIILSGLFLHFVSMDPVAVCRDMHKSYIKDTNFTCRFHGGVLAYYPLQEEK